MSDTYDPNTDEEQVNQTDPETGDVPPEQAPGEVALPYRGGVSMDWPEMAENESAATWEDYAAQAVHSLYPHMREGVDYSFGRKTPDGKPELVFQDEEKFAAIDMGRVQEIAQRLRDADPYAKYEPKKGFWPGVIDDPENTKLSKL